MGVIMELQNGMCVWPTTRAGEEEEEVEEEAEWEAANEGAGGSAKICEADYPPYGYHGLMPPGYAYRPDPSHDGSS
ncbi:hypothetical protein Tco_0880396 [Tanacetum coccineum]